MLFRHVDFILGRFLHCRFYLKVYFPYINCFIRSFIHVSKAKHYNLEYKFLSQSAVELCFEGSVTIVLHVLTVLE